MTGAAMLPDHTARLKRIRYRAWHRGTKEMDLILGGFADEALDSLSAQELDDLEALMVLPDQQVYAWIVGREDVPRLYDTAVMRAIKAKRHVVSGL